MDTSTGHLIDLEKLPEYRGRPGYEPIPPALHAAALEKLKGEAEAHVRMQGDGPLSDFRRAARRRAARAEQKSAKKAEKMARKRNR